MYKGANNSLCLGECFVIVQKFTSLIALVFMHVVRIIIDEDLKMLSFYAAIFLFINCFNCHWSFSFLAALANARGAI